MTIGGLKRLEVARVMAMKPRVLLLDEVMAGINQTDVRRAIDPDVPDPRQRRQHHCDRARQCKPSCLCRTALSFLNSGQIIAEREKGGGGGGGGGAKPHDVVRDPTVVEAYLGKEFVHAQA